MPFVPSEEEGMKTALQMKDIKVSKAKQNAKYAKSNPVKITSGQIQLNVLFTRFYVVHGTFHC